MEFKSENKLLEIAVNAPRIFVDASLGRGDYEGEVYNREPGIQLTKEQVISLRKYETLGLSLPIEVSAIRDYLNYGAGDDGGVGLKVEDFRHTFKMTFDHASRWRPLRESIMLTGTHLRIFSGRIIGTGNEIVNIYKRLGISGYLEEHGIDTIEEYLRLKHQFPEIPGLEVPEEAIDDIGYYLNEMLDDIKGCHTKAEEVRQALDSFGADMRTKVLPQIKLRLKAVSENTYGADIQLLQKQIDARADEIDKLNEQYDKLVKEAIAAAMVSLVGLVVGIYYGVKAENVRSERNKLRQEQALDNQRMASKNQTLSSLNKVRDDLQNLNYVAIEAEVATQNLMLVWNALSLFVKSSFDDLDRVENAIKLSRLINAIERVILPWHDVKSSSDELLKVFAAADREYEEGRVMRQARSAIMLQSSGFQMAQLVSHDGVVREADTTAQMLSRQFLYLPGPVGSMHTLAESISDATYGVRVQCQQLDLKLTKSLSNLKGLMRELGDPADDEEIREEIEEELQIAGSLLAMGAATFVDWKRGISGRFDRAVSGQWIITLQKDRTYALEQKTTAEERVAELTERMNSVWEAIELIERAGIEKIGSEVQLSLESLKALGLAPPQIQVALLALDTLKKLISGIGQAISFLKMLAAYNTLKDRAKELRSQVESFQKDLVTVDGKVALVEALEALDDGRWDFLTEFSKLIAEVERFNRDLIQDKTLSLEDRVNLAIEKIPQVADYMQSVYR